MNIINKIAIGFMCVVLCAQSHASSLNIQHFENDTLGKQGTKWAAHQHNNGTIFVASTTGLYSYDGSSWRHHMKGGNDDIRQIVVKEEGVYAGVESDFGIYKPQSNGTLDYISLAQSRPELKHMSTVNNVLPLQQRVVFVAAEVITLWHKTEPPVFIYPKNSFRRAWQVNDVIYATDGNASLLKITDKNAYEYIPTPITGRVGFVQEFSGKLLIGFYKGGIYEYENGAMRPWLSPTTPSIISESGFYNTTILASGNIAVASIFNGVLIFDKSGNLISHITVDNGLKTNVTLNVFEDNQQGLWILQEGNVARVIAPDGITLFSQQDYDLVKIRQFSSLNDTLYVSAINGFAKVDSSHSVEIIPSVTNSASDSTSLNNSIVVGGSGPCVQYAPETGDLNTVIKATRCGDFVFSNTFPNTIVAMTENGIYSNELEAEPSTWGTPLQILQSTQITSKLVQDKKGIVWTSDRHGNLYKIHKDNGEWHYDIEKNIGGEFIPLVIFGELYLSLNNRLVSYDHKTHNLGATPKWFASISQQFKVSPSDVFITADGVHWLTNGDESVRIFQNDSGEIMNLPGFDSLVPFVGFRSAFLFHDHYWLGYEDGFAQVKKQLKVPTIADHVSVARVTSLTTNEIIASNVFKQTNIPILPASSSVQVEFAHTNFNKTSPLYSYKINNGNWSLWRDEPFIDFIQPASTQIDLNVKVNTERLLQHEPVSLTIKFQQLWYKTGWFFALCIVFIALIVSLSNHFYHRYKYSRLRANRLLLKQEVQKRTKTIEAQSEELQRVSQLKDRFFANISHELRTPLTLIQGPLQLLKQRSVLLNSEDEKHLSVALSNTETLLKLINQLLDIEKLAADSTPIHAVHINPTEQINKLLERYSEMSTAANIEVLFNHHAFLDNVWFDLDHFNKIASNLFHNSLKFSPKNSTVEVSFKQHSGHYTFSVSDQGKGLSDDELKSAFDRFWQSTNPQTPNNIGSGIGLSLACELAELNKCSLSAKNNTNAGCVFELTIPTGRERYSADELKSDAESSQGTQENYIAEQEVIIPQLHFEGSDKPLVLVVEDNPEMAEYISQCLSSHYLIHTAEDGEKGIKAVHEHMPDFIVSDVMMPVVDGLHFCQNLQQDPSTSHIPILLLSAGTTANDKIKGLLSGATDYLIKPFDPDELKLRIHTQLRLRAEHARTVLKSHSILMQPKTSQANEESDKIIECIQANFNDPEFNVEKLAQALFLDRTTLFRKVKEQFNQPPSQVIRDCRLKAAKQLLESGDASISEVAYSVGFQSLNYFSRTFKSEFKMTPSEFISQID